MRPPEHAPTADTGPDLPATLEPFLQKSEEWIWPELRRILAERGVLGEAVLAEAWATKEPHESVFLLVFRERVFALAYRWIGEERDHGTLRAFEDVTDSELAHAFQHAIRHARAFARVRTAL
ncbi:MAG: hypothetical protein U0271_01795 [Polyangiaceae bacterium]